MLRILLTFMGFLLIVFGFSRFLLVILCFLDWELDVAIDGLFVDGWPSVQLLSVHDIEDLQTIRFLFERAGLNALGCC